MVTKQGGLRQTLLSSIGSKDQVARTDGLSVTSPMPGRSCRQQVTGSSTGKQAQDTEVRLCETFSPGQSLFRDSPHFFFFCQGCWWGKGAVSNTLIFHSF